MMSKALEDVLIGAGNRGSHAYGEELRRRPELERFTAVVEPHAGRRERLARLHGIPPERSFGSWDELFGRPQLADAAVICTMDTEHVEPTLWALNAGYHVLLEKPMAVTKG